MDRHAAIERLAVHAAYGLHIVAKWISENDAAASPLKERLATHLMGIDSSLRMLGHSALHEEIEQTENRLRPR